MGELREDLLTNRLKAAGRSYQAEEARSFVCRTLKYFLITALVFFVADVIFHFGASVRVGLLGFFGIALLAILAWAWYLARIRQNRLEQVARLVETLEPSLGSKVINILQLEQQSQDPRVPSLTRELARAAVAEYATALQGVNFRGIAHLPRLRLDRRHALMATGVFALILLAGGSISSTELARYGDPYGDHPAYSFTRLSITTPNEKGAQIVYGKNATVRVSSAGHLPREVLLTLYDPRHPERKATLPMFGNGKGGFSQQIENVRSDLVIVAHTANEHSMSRQRRIGVLLTPRIEKTSVDIQPPAYTGLQPEHKPVDPHPLKALEGSTLRFHLQSNRPLRAGVIQTGGEAASQFAMEKSAENEVSGNLRAETSGPLRFGIVDVDGLSSDQPFDTMLTVSHDLPPQVSISNPARDALVCIDYELKAQIDASDDYGLRMVRIHCAVNGVFLPPLVMRSERLLRTASYSILLDFYDLGAEPGDTITLFAEAIDTAPSPHTARSQTVTITLISEDEYNQFIRQQSDLADVEVKYTDVLDRFQQKIDDQKKISKKLEELRDLMAKSKNQDSLESQYQDLVDEQSDVNRELEDLADEMDSLVRPDPAYDVEKELQKSLNEKAKSIRESTAENDSKMQPLASKDPTHETVSQFDQAAQEQTRKLEGTQEKAKEEVAQTLTDLEKLQSLLKDFNQFEELYGTQKDLEAQNRAYNRSGDLSREDQLALRNLATTEKFVESQLGGLTQKLREDSKAAESKFPKAAQNGRALADSIEKQRMQPLASQATDAMLKGHGDQSWQLTEKLRSEMEKLFGDSQSGQGDQQSEMAGYLSQRQMKPGDTFKQMQQSQKYAIGKGTGKGQGTGSGMGMAANAQGSASQMDVMGKESRISQSSGAGASSQPRPSSPGGSSFVQNKADAPTGIKPVQRASEAVQSEAPLDQYADLVNSYFKAITK